MKNNKGYTPPEVEKWISDNLDADINLKARMAAVYLMTTTKEIQDRVIDGLYCNHDGDFYQDKIARSVIEKVVRTEAKEGIPLFLFTGHELLNAEPDTFRTQQNFER